jgi:hypothetical protein
MGIHQEQEHILVLIKQSKENLDDIIKGHQTEHTDPYLSHAVRVHAKTGEVIPPK